MPRKAEENPNRYAILGMLNYEPKYGYNLKEETVSTIGFFWPKLTFGKIYPTLKQLEKEDLVEMKKIHEPESERERKMYHITSRGRRELKEWLEQPIRNRETYNFFEMMQEVLLKVYFSAVIEPEKTIEMIEQLKEAAFEISTILSQYAMNQEAVLDEEKDHQYYVLTAYLGQEIAESIVKWVEISKEILEKKIK